MSSPWFDDLTAWWTCVALLLAAVFWWRWADYLQAGSRLPGPPAWPLIGNLPLVSGDPPTLFNMVVGLHTTYGRLVRFWVGPKLVVFMTDPADIQTVFGDVRVVNRDFFLLLPFHKILGEGLLSSRGDAWASSRRLFGQAFSNASLKRYVGTFGLRAEELVARLDEVADGRTVDPLDALGHMALESVRDTVYGSTADWPEENFMEMFLRGGRLMTKCAIRPWLMFEAVFRWTDDGRTFYKLRQEVNERSSKMIQTKLAEFQNEIPSEDRTKSFMDALIEAMVLEEGGVGELSVTQLQQQLNHLVVAAIDTSTTVLANFLSLMGIYPEIQKQVVAELEDIFGGDSRLPTPDDLHRMKLIGRCLKEAMRLFTPAPWNSREIDQAVTLPSGLVVPRGAVVVVNGFSVHRDPENYVEPGRYWPDRWLEENNGAHHPYAYFAFGGGRRNCIGQKYAWLQMKTAVSCVFRRFRVTSLSTLESMDRFGALPVLRPLEGYQIQLHRLEK